MFCSYVYYEILSLVSMKKIALIYVCVLQMSYVVMLMLFQHV